jgi:autotransporter passenger strand-loop-strand repeat protein
MQLSGTGISTTINPFGIEWVYAGGTDISATVNAGFQAIQGGTASAAQVLYEGTQSISGGANGAFGSAISTRISSGGQMLVLSGGVASATTLGIGGSGFVDVRSGGTAIGTVVNAFAVIEIESGGTTSLTTLSGVAANENIEYGGVSSDTTVSGGAQNVDGEADNTNVQAGGEQIIDSGGTANATVISGGANVYVDSGGSADLANVNGGNLYVSSGGTAAFTTISGGFVDVKSGGVVADEITFENGGILQIDGTTMPAATISGFAPGDTIDLTGLNRNGATYTLRPGNVFHIVVAGGQSYDLDFDPSQNLTVGQFEFSPGAGGGIQIAIAAQTTVGNGQTVTVQNGQTQAGITVAANGLLMIDPGGTVDGTNVDTGGTVNDTGTTLESIVSGGLEVLFSGGTASATTVSRGGEEYVASGARPSPRPSAAAVRNSSTARPSARP